MNSNNGTIFLNVNELTAKVEQLKNQQQRMEILFSRIKSDANGMINYWSGNSGEKAYTNLNDYTKSFEFILANISKYIKYLEDVISAYKLMDDAIQNKMETNANVSAI